VCDAGLGARIRDAIEWLTPPARGARIGRSGPQPNVPIGCSKPRRIHPAVEGAANPLTAGTSG
jgi:hypothetical protein